MTTIDSLVSATEPISRSSANAGGIVGTTTSARAFASSPPASSNSRSTSDAAPAIRNQRCAKPPSTTPSWSIPGARRHLTSAFSLPVPVRTPRGSNRFGPASRMTGTASSSTRFVCSRRVSCALRRPPALSSIPRERHCSLTRRRHPAAAMSRSRSAPRNESDTVSGS